MRKTLFLMIIIILLIILLLFKIIDYNNKTALDLYHSIGIEDTYEIITKSIKTDKTLAKVPSDKIIDVSIKKLSIYFINVKNYNKVISRISKEEKEIFDEHYVFDENSKAYNMKSKLDIRQKEMLSNMIYDYPYNISYEDINFNDWGIDYGYETVYRINRSHTIFFLNKDDVYRSDDKEIRIGYFSLGKFNSLSRFFSNKILQVKKEVNINQENYLLKIIVKV